MVKRDNHYEVAFETYLRRRRVPYVAVNEMHRSRLGSKTLKNLDFIVSPKESNCSFLVDVKGRRFPTGKSKQYWKNWSTVDELESLSQWEALFGNQFQGLLVFAYNVLGDRAPLPAEQLFECRGALYGFVTVRLDHYLSWSRTISPKWNTVAMPTSRFRDLARPADELFLADEHASTLVS